MPEHDNKNVLHPTLSANLRALMDAHATLTTQAAVGKVAKIDQRTVGRIINGTHSPTLKAIEALAKAFELAAWQLLMPGLEPGNPPVAQTSREKAMYLRMQELAAQLPKR